MHGIEFESRNPADWEHGVTCAVFLIHGKSDKTIPHKHGEQIFERLDTFKELWLVEGTGHTKAFSSSPAEHRGDLPLETLRSILREAGLDMSFEQFRRV